MEVSQEKSANERKQYKVVNGRKIIKAVDVLVIAEALEVTPNDLYGIVEEKDAS